MPNVGEGRAYWHQKGLTRMGCLNFPWPKPNWWLWIRGWHYQQGVNIASWLGMSKPHLYCWMVHHNQIWQGTVRINFQHAVEYHYNEPFIHQPTAYHSIKSKENPAWRFLSSPERSTSCWICSNFTSLTSWMGNGSWETIQENQENYRSLQTISTKVEKSADFLPIRLDCHNQKCCHDGVASDYCQSQTCWRINFQVGRRTHSLLSSRQEQMDRMDAK